MLQTVKQHPAFVLPVPREIPVEQPEGAQAFADWIVSGPAQQRIGEFGKEKFGQPLFFPDAGKDEASLGS